MTDTKTASNISSDSPKDDLAQTPDLEIIHAGHVSEEERVRHERFHQAVRRFLAEGSLQGSAVRPAKYTRGRYARLLSTQELQFLLR